MQIGCVYMREGWGLSFPQSYPCPVSSWSAPSFITCRRREWGLDTWSLQPTSSPPPWQSQVQGTLGSLSPVYLALLPPPWHASPATAPHRPAELLAAGSNGAIRAGGSEATSWVQEWGRDRSKQVPRELGDSNPARGVGLPTLPVKLQSPPWKQDALSCFLRDPELGWPG
jgi:hypothetical protein